jgi:hypothetical protein
LFLLLTFGLLFIGCNSDEEGIVIHVGSVKLGAIAFDPIVLPEPIYKPKNIFYNKKMEL